MYDGMNDSVAVYVYIYVCMCKEYKYIWKLAENVIFILDDAVVVEKVSERVQRPLHVWNAGLHLRIELRHPLPPTGRPYTLHTNTILP